MADPVTLQDSLTDGPGSERESRAVHREVLPNGLTVLLCESRVAPVAEVQIWCRVGSADERSGEEGLAHFHEHMLFKGTERRGVGEVAGEVEGAGGRINAYTSYDVTVYHATMPNDAASVGLDVLADAVLHSRFEPEEIEREIEVVLEEIRRSHDSPAHVLSEAVMATAYTVHPYRSPILGSAGSVASLDRARLRSFYERWYTPENLAVVAVGDFETPRLLAEIGAALGGAGAAPGGSRGRAVEPPQQGLRATVLARPFERARVELVYPAIALAHPDAPLLDLLAFILGNGDSSRLVRRVKERAALCDRIDAGCYTPLDPGLFSVNLESDPGLAADAIAAVVREVEQLRAEPVSDEEIEKARANFLASEYFERESVSGLAHKLGAFEITAGGYRAEERYLAAVRSATPKALQRAARRYLAPERLSVGAMIPEAEATRPGALDEEVVARAVRSGSERAARAFSAPARSGRARGAGAAIESYQLEGGTRLHVVPRRGVPVVAARAALLGGLLAETPEQAGLSAFLASMWLRGTRGRSAADFARQSEGLAVEIDSFAGRSCQGLTLEAPSDRLEPALELFSEVLLEPAFDPEELERERRDTLAAIERREDRLAQRAFLLFAETHYPTHPYRRPLLGNALAVQGFDTPAVQRHHERLVRAGNLVLAVAGDVDPDALAARVSARLSDLDPRPFEAALPAQDPPPGEVRRAELHKDRAQAHLVIGFRGVSVDDPDRDALEVISQLLAGQGGRLFLELRDKQSLAYSVSASNVEGVAPGYFATYIATAPEKLEEAQAGLLRELEALLAAPPPPDELERAKRYLTGNFQIDLQRNAAHAAHVSLDALYGLGPAAYAGYAERVRAVGAEDVLRVARRIIDLGAYTLAVVRP